MQLEIIISDSLETYIRKYSAIEPEIALYNLTNHKSRETIQQNCSRETQVLTSHKFLKETRMWTYPIQDGGERAKKVPPTSFSPVTSTNVGISHQNFLIFSFNPFPTLL